MNLLDDYAAVIPARVISRILGLPAANIPRFTLEDVEIDGHVVPADRILILSAMRDPAVYADPDTFNIKRTDHRPKHPVFGGGAHRCPGEALARVELEEGLAALTTRLPGLQFVGNPPAIYGYAGVRRVTGMRVGRSIAGSGRPVPR
jgi:cytochrome P450 family 103